MDAEILRKGNGDISTKMVLETYLDDIAPRIIDELVLVAVVLYASIWDTAPLPWDKKREAGRGGG